MGDQLRELLIEDDEILVLPGVFDAFTAKLVESIGFPAVYLGGYSTGVSTALTEQMTTRTKMVEKAREIVHAVDSPLVVDGDGGFGNPSHTYTTVSEYAKTGIAGIHIEDQLYPKRMHYHEGRHHIIDIGEMENKIKAATSAKEDSGSEIVLIARSDAARGERRQSETIGEAIDRINQYFAAGAEAGMVFPSSNEDTKFAVEQADGPMIHVSLESGWGWDTNDNYEPSLTVEELDELGYAGVIFCCSATVAAAKSVKNIYKNVYERGQTGLDAEEFQQLRKEIDDIINIPHYYDIESESGKK